MFRIRLDNGRFFNDEFRGISRRRPYKHPKRVNNDDIRGGVGNQRGGPQITGHAGGASELV